MTYATNLRWRQASAIYAAASAHSLPISLSFFLFLFRFLLLICALPTLSHFSELSWLASGRRLPPCSTQLFYIIKQIAFPLTSFFICPPSHSLSGSLSETSLMHLSNMAHIYICRENCIIPYAMLPLYDFCAYFTLLPKLLPVNSLAFFWWLCSALVCKTLHS